MSKARENSVKFTGADTFDELIGLEYCNQGLRIQIHENQKKEEKFGGRVKGSFKLLDAGSGEYHQYLKKFVGGIFEANYLIENVCEQIRQNEKRELKGLQIFNCNILKGNLKSRE